MSDERMFSVDAVKRRSNSLGGVNEAMAAYYEGVERANIELLGDVFDDHWLMKDTDTPHAMSLNVEDKQTFMRRVSGHGPYLEYGKDRVIDSISMLSERVAWVRVNRNPGWLSTNFLLVRRDAGWKMLDKIWVNPREPHSGVVPPDGHGVVERRVDGYYKALAFGHFGSLTRFIHDRWEVKTISSESILVETWQQYLSRAKAIPRIYGGFNQILSIESYHDRLAIVRADFPTIEETHVLVVFKMGDEWTLTSTRIVQR